MSTDLQDYDVLGIIGSGAFGTCYKVKNIYTNEIYVWKAIGYGSMSEEKKQLLCSEVNLLADLTHPNIVKYYTRILHKETATLYIITEWCEGGDLATVIKETKELGKLIEEWFVWRVLYQLSKAVLFLHNVHNILHRDIKPANIFLDCQGNVKLADFGLANVCHENRVKDFKLAGTPLYMSPEVLKGCSYNKKSDIWSLGCLIYEMCALCPPFTGSDMLQLLNNIIHRRFDGIPKHYSESLGKIINMMLTVSSKERPGIEAIVHHPAVVVNNSKTPKIENLENLKSRNDKAQKLCDNMNALLLADKEPEDVSKKLFKEKWLARLETVRLREARLKEKENQLSEKEHCLNKKEKRVELLERAAKDKVARARVYLNQCKQARRHPLSKRTNETDASFSADPGDTSLMPTSAKIDPQAIRKPNFKDNKHVHFEDQATLQDCKGSSSSGSAELSYVHFSNRRLYTSENQQTTYIDQLKYSSCEIYKKGKENKAHKKKATTPSNIYMTSNSTSYLR